MSDTPSDEVIEAVADAIEEAEWECRPSEPRSIRYYLEVGMDAFSHDSRAIRRPLTLNGARAAIAALSKGRSMTSGGLTMTEGWNLQLQGRVRQLEEALRRVQSLIHNLPRSLTADDINEVCSAALATLSEADVAEMLDEAPSPAGALTAEKADAIEAGRIAIRDKWGDGCSRGCSLESDRDRSCSCQAMAIFVIEAVVENVQAPDAGIRSALSPSSARERRMEEALEEAWRRLLQAAAVLEKLGHGSAALGFLSDAKQVKTALSPSPPATGKAES